MSADGPRSEHGDTRRSRERSAPSRRAETVRLLSTDLRLDLPDLRVDGRIRLLGSDAAIDRGVDRLQDEAAQDLLLVGPQLFLQRQLILWTEQLPVGIFRWRRAERRRRLRLRRRDLRWAIGLWRSDESECAKHQGCKHTASLSDL